MQTKWMSFIEACSNIALGTVINFAAGFLIYPVFGMPVSIATNIGVTLSFTLLSLTRSYLVRRFFNKGGKNVRS